MSNFHPRSRLASHEVINQPEVPGDIPLMSDPAMCVGVDNAFARLSHVSGVWDSDVAR